MVYYCLRFTGTGLVTPSSSSRVAHPGPGNPSMPRESRFPNSPPSASTEGDKTFRFLDLPPELRNYIYELCIPTNTHQDPIRRWCEDRESIWIIRFMMRVCKQISRECLAMYCSTNIFSVPVKLGDPRCFAEPLNKGMIPLVSRFGEEKAFQDLHFNLSSTGRRGTGPWPQLGKFGPLIEFLRVTGMKATTIPARMETTEAGQVELSRLKAQKFKIFLAHGNNWKVAMAAVSELLDLGMQAGREAWSKEKLEARIKASIEEVHSRGVGRRAMRKYEKYMIERRMYEELEAKESAKIKERERGGERDAEAGRRETEAVKRIIAETSAEKPVVTRTNMKTALELPAATTHRTVTDRVWEFNPGVGRFLPQLNAPSHASWLPSPQHWAPQMPVFGFAGQQQYAPPGQQHPPPSQQHWAPQMPVLDFAGRQYAPSSGQQYAPPGQQYAAPDQQHPPPGQQYAPSSGQQYAPSLTQQYTASPSSQPRNTYSQAMTSYPGPSRWC